MDSMGPLQKPSYILAEELVVGILWPVRGSAPCQHPLAQAPKGHGALGPDLSHGGPGGQQEQAVHQDPFHGPVHLGGVPIPEADSEHILRYPFDHVGEPGKTAIQGRLLNHPGGSLRVEEEGQGHVGG